MEKLSRREREKLQHRQEILDAARGLFVRKGFERTSMAEIAEAAEFAVGTLYKFFKDKETLYRALILDTVKIFHDALTDALNSPGTETEKLERYIEKKAELFVQFIPEARIYLSQTAGASFIPTAILHKETREIFDDVLDVMESLFKSGIRKKLFIKAEPRMLVLALEGMSNAFLEALVERPDDFSAEDLGNLTKTLFFEKVKLQ